MPFNFLSEEDELDPMSDAPRPRVMPRKPFDLSALRAAAADGRPMAPPLDAPPDAAMPAPDAPNPDFLRVIGAAGRTSTRSNNPRQADYEAKLAAAAEMRNQPPEAQSPKWWQRVAAVGTGALAGAVNAGGRVQVDPRGAVDTIYEGPQQRRRLEDWTRKVEGADAQAQAAKSGLDAWRQGETQDRQDALADAQIEHYRGQTERDRAAADAKPKAQIVPAGSSIVDSNGKVLFTAPPNQPSRPTIVPAGSTVVGADGKVIFTAPAKEPAERNLNVNDVLLNPDKYTPEQRKKAQEMFDKSHRPPASANVGSGDESLIAAALDNPIVFQHYTKATQQRIAPQLQAKNFSGFGKEQSESALNKMSESKSAVEGLRDLRKTLQENEQYIGPVAGYQALNPWSDARKAQAKIDTVRQRVGKALEGGVLRKEDEEKYKRILATLNDEPETAIFKVDNLIETIDRDMEIFKAEQRAAGRRVPETPKSPAPPGGGSPPAVKTKAEYDALPSGTVYLEDGKKFKKP